MKRYIDLNDITDGKKYGSNDMVRADSFGCAGCSGCCKNCETILLDPFDIYELENATSLDFNGLLESALELQVMDGVILPKLSMNGEKEGCSFLNEEGRCRVHVHRPGICRLFPLARVYEEGKMYYVLQKDECPKARGKVKVSKWLGIERLEEYETFVLQWHYFLNALEKKLEKLSTEEKKDLNMRFLKAFYLTEFRREKDIFEQIAKRMEVFRKREAFEE